MSIPSAVLGRFARGLFGAVSAIGHKISSLQLRPQGAAEFTLPRPEEFPLVLTPQSSWVYSFVYRPVMNSLDTQFKDKQGRLTALCRYPNIRPGSYYAFARAASKGKFVHAFLYQRPYILLNKTNYARKPRFRKRAAK